MSLVGNIVVKEGDLVKHTRSIVVVPTGKTMLERVVNALGVPDRKGALNDHKRRYVKVHELNLWFNLVEKQKSIWSKLTIKH